MTSEQSQPARQSAGQTQSPDDCYRDRTRGWRRKFTLSGDRLVIESKQLLGSESVITVLLRDVNPMYSIVRLRSPMAGAGVLVLAIMFMVAAFLPYVDTTTGPRVSLWTSVTHGPMGICLGVALLYAIVGLIGTRRVEHYEFTARGVRFSIARKGPDRNRFDAFVERLLARVQDAQRPHNRSQTSTSSEVPPPGDPSPPRPPEPGK